MKTHNKIIIIAGTIFNIFAILYFQKPPDNVLIFFIIFWLAVSLSISISDNVFIAVSLGFLLLSMFYMLLDNQSLANRFSTWEFNFIITGITNWLINELLSKVNVKSLKKIIQWVKPGKN